MFKNKKLNKMEHIKKIKQNVFCRFTHLLPFTVLLLSLSYSQSSNISPSQVKALQGAFEEKKSINNTNNNTELRDNDLSLPSQTSLRVYDDGNSDVLIDSLQNERVFFGYDFFTLRDSIPFWENLPTPPNYLLGPGDEIIVSLWGDTQIRQSYKITREGKIYDEKVGLLNVAGLSIEKAEVYLLKQFGRVYATLNGRNPKTYFDLSIGQLRSINVNFVGEVKFPGIHLVHPFSNVINGLIQVGGVDTTGSLRKIKVIRNKTVLKEVDLYDYLLKGESINNIQLRDSDIVMIPTRKTSVEVKSGVIRPAVYEFIEGESAEDIINIAGGLTHLASSTVGIKRIVPIRKRIKGLNETENYYFNYESSSKIKLQPGDQISINNIFESKNYVEIIGQVKRPGKYFFQEGMSINDLVMLSGGLLDTTFTKSVYMKSGQIIRKNIDSRFETVLKININDIIHNNGDGQIKLQNLDRFVIHPNLNFYERANIVIEGQVKIPGSYPIQSEKESLADLIQRAGGISKGASENGISIHRLNKYFDFISEGEDISLGQSNNRIKLAWENLNVKLMPGDSITVKESPMTVVVSGQVYNPGLVEYVNGRSLRTYINLAGGITNDGDKDNIIITYPNGVVKPKKWYSSPKIKDGSQIIVNTKPPQEPFNVTQFATNWTSIISSMITAVILSQQLSSQ